MAKNTVHQKDLCNIPYTTHSIAPTNNRITIITMVPRLK